MTSKYLLNTWYLASWSGDLNTGALLGRTLLEKPLVLFRDQSGNAVALPDRCPHRMVPLSRGWVENGLLRCGYHGLGFSGSGECVLNPHGAISKSAHLQSYPTHEIYGAVWIWMGDPDKADIDLIPDLSVMETEPKTAVNMGYLHANAGYLLYVDNILDLTHADFLHKDTLGGGALTRNPAKIEYDETSLTSTWVALNDRAQPFFDKFLPEQNQPANITVKVHWYAPSVMCLINEVEPAKNHDGDSVAIKNFHIFTPETAQTTHYFFASTRNFGREDAELNRLIADTRQRVFSTEDTPMLEAQQRQIGENDLMACRPMILSIDKGSMHCRRLLGNLIEKESVANVS